jgi:hypothetical protein
VDWQIVYALDDRAWDRPEILEILNAGRDDELPEEYSKRTDMQITWRALAEMSRAIDLASPKINDFINGAPDEGKRDMRMIVAVDLLSDIWAERKGVSARKKVADASPFARFVAEAFEALGVGYDARSSINSWHEYQKKNPTPRDWRCGRPRK